MILSWTSPQAVPVIMTASLGVGLLTVLIAPRLGRPRRASPLSVEGLQDAPKLLNRYFVLFVTGAGVINGSHGFMYGFASIYWKSIGLGDTLMGFLWAFAVVSEVCVFMAFTRVFGRFRATTLLMICGRRRDRALDRLSAGLAARAGRAGFFAVQALHGLSTGIMLIGVQKLIAETVDEERTGAAQGAAFFASGDLHGDRDLAVGPALRSLRRVGLLRDDRRRAGRAGAGPAFGRLSPRAPARAVIPANRGRPAPASGRAPTAAARRDR